jgi:hypothetical protein
MVARFEAMSEETNVVGYVTVDTVQRNLPLNSIILI